MEAVDILATVPVYMTECLQVQGAVAHLPTVLNGALFRRGEKDMALFRMATVMAQPRIALEKRAAAEERRKQHHGGNA